MTQAEIQAEAERRYSYERYRKEGGRLPESEVNGWKSCFIEGCNFATSRHEEEMKEAVELLQQTLTHLQYVGETDLIEQIDQFLNRVNPKK